MVRIALIGCTGSIGSQVLEVVRRYPDRFQISALVAGSNAARLAALVNEFHPRIAFCANAVGGMPEASSHEELFADCDVAFVAASGFAGLAYTMSAIEAGKTIALANKESLVCGGELVMRAAKERGVAIIPVDSEHSAIFQALGCRREARFKKLVLTASGGPFLHYTKEQLARVTAQEALKHPTWNMGAKVTIDSATLLNKGYEVIEAKWLYGADFSAIEAVVHPESIVHSLVYFEDGAALAQLGYPDMRVPIQLSLSYPERLPCAPALDLATIGTLHFERLPTEKFPCYGLALAAGRSGGSAPTILNAAAEEAVRAFLSGGIAFPQIAETIENSLSHIPMSKIDAYEDLFEVDQKAREAAKTFIHGK